MKTIRTMLLTLTTLLAFMIIFLPTVENKEEPAIVTMRNEEASASSPLGFSQPSSAVGRLIGARPQDPELSRMFRQYDLLNLNGAAGARQIRSSGRVSLSTSWGVFDLELAPNDLRAPDYTAQSIGSDGVVRRLSETEITTFKGSVSRFQGGQARFTVTEDSLEGLIIVEGERFFVQPARLLSKQAQADEFVFYRGSDVRLESGECGVTLAAQIEAERERNLNSAAWLSSKATNSGAVPPLTTLKVIRIATDADAEYVAALGGVAAANSQIMNIMNQVDGIYQVELGLTFQLVLQNSWTDAATDPYSSTVASDLLTQFRTYWGSNFTNVQRSLAHLWTGKDLDGATIGIAYISVTCSSAAFSYGISQRFPITELNPITIQTVTLTAHELGHAFSARHTNQATTTVPREVEVACMDTIMESGIGDGGSFCPYSRLQVTGFANANQTCLTDTSAPTPVVSPCAAIPVMTNGSPRNGSLASSDCQSPSRGVSFYADRYWFDALAGQNVLIVLNKSITGLDPYLYLIGPSGYVVSQDDDSNSNQNSRLEFKLPHSGRYVIEATSFGVKQTGDYTLLTTVSSCGISVSPASVQIPAGGISGALNVTGCGSYDFRAYTNPNDGSWLVHQISGGSGNQSLNYIAQANPNAAGRTGFLIVGSDNAGRGGIWIPVVQSGTGSDCVSTPITIGQIVPGTLTTSNCQSPIRGNGYFSNRYSFAIQAGEQVAIAVTSPNFDTFLTLIGPNGAVLFNDDDSGGGANSRIPGSGVLTLGIPGTYIIEVNGFTAGVSGSYTLSLARPQTTIQLSSATYTLSESTGRLDLPVTRSGDSSGAASVDYTTLGPSYVPCATAEGTALQNCDYSIGAGTLRFAPGEVTKTLTLLINDDFYTEGDEVLTLLLSNPVGTDLGTVDSATITVQDDDSATPTTNPLDVAQFFVGQHYYDFLSRFPDSGGLDYWSFQITQCGNDAVCIKKRLVDVSNAFFYELEYQQTGAYVFRLYRAAFGNNQPAPNPDPENINESKKLPAYAVFVSDRARVVAGSNLAQSQLEFASALVQRPAFLARYPAQLNGPAFVDAVLTTIRNDSGSDLTSQRDALISLYNSGGRGAVMYRLADDNLQTNPIDNRQFIDDEYNRAFVFTEYAGYLRRDSDVGGFLFWLAKINESPVRDANIQHTMVCAFITSEEYQRRFSPVATRSNADCAP